MVTLAAMVVSPDAVLAKPARGGGGQVAVETFTQPDELWPEGSEHGPFRVVFNGYGTVGVVNQRLRLSPNAATSPDVTHAALVTATAPKADTNLSVSMTAISQLRTGSEPNPWETGWVIWNYVSNNEFWYLIPKPNGWELGRVDPSLGQVFLATGPLPETPIGVERDMTIRHVRDRLTILFDGATVYEARDQNATKTNIVGFYTEDATVDFDDISLG